MRTFTDIAYEELKCVTAFDLQCPKNYLDGRYFLDVSIFFYIII